MGFHAVQQIRVQTEARHLGAPNLPIPTQWSWDVSDPIAVSVSFGADETPVTWVFGRSLLRDAFARTRAGDGDVTITTEPQGAFLSLSSPGGAATFAFDRNALATFIQQTYAVCDELDEYAIAGRELTELLRQLQD